MNNPLLKSMKIGFIGAGNMTQAMVRGLVESKLVKADHIIISNRTPGKLIKLSEQYGVQTREHNQQVVEECDVVVLAMKPQDLPAAAEAVANHFDEHKIIVSLAAGINLKTLQKIMPTGRHARLMPNTPSVIGRGVIGYLAHNDDAVVSDIIEDLFSSLGTVIAVENEDQFDALMISCSSGTGFIFEMMMYWQDWIAERGFTPEDAKKMTIETFLGASMLAAQSGEIEIEELQSRVTSKKGVTAAGLNSMRELEIERALRISFEKSALRSKELANESQRSPTKV